MPELERIRQPHPEVQRRIHKALLEARMKRPPNVPPVLYMSGVGECVRKLWAECHDQVGGPEFPAHMLAIFELGSGIEKHVIELLRLAGYLVTDEQKLSVVSFEKGTELRGRRDGTILLGRRKFDLVPAILEVKSANKERWELCEAQGYEEWSPKYMDVLQCYMGASGIHVSLAVVYCKDDSRIYAEKILFDKARYEKVLSKADTALTSRTPPPRPKEATSEFSAFCRFCSARSWCWGPLPSVQFDD